ncbi:MAG: alpha/beta fold hydrolase [Caldimonas sp.]
MTHLPILALPGLLDDERLWHHQAAALGADHPLTSFALTPQASMAELAEMALDRAPAGRFALMGLSMGGYLALEIMRKAPERVAALALLDTSARPETPQASELRRTVIAQSASDFGAVMTAFMPRILHPSRLGDAALVDLLEKMAAGIGREGFVRQQQAIMGRSDSRPTLAAIRCPTLVLCGREDLLTPLELHEEMATGIAGSRLVVLDGCGHMSALEKPAEVNEALRGWLARVVPA